MPITDIAPQLPTAFAIRLGRTEDAVSQDGKHYSKPVHLEGQLRITSLLRSVATQIAESYAGSEVEPWDRGQVREWETVLPRRPLRVILLPGSWLSQWWEMWVGPTCERRCDGVTERLSGRPCLCGPTEQRKDPRTQCRPTSRITVLLPRMTTLCAGRLTSGSIVAASTLLGSVEGASLLLDSGHLLDAVLTIRERTGKSHYYWPEITIEGAHHGTLEIGERSEASDNGAARDTLAGPARQALAAGSPAEARDDSGGDPAGS